MKARYELLRKSLAKRCLILDGSMGALLQKRNLPPGHAPDLWNLENPEAILQVHREYVDAGADILITNTFGASRLRLDEYKAADKVREINQRAVAIARKAGPERIFVAGDIGPCGDTIYPTGKRSFDEIFDIFREQIAALVSEGADAIIVETMFDSLDFKAALAATRDVSRDIPLIALMTFNTDGISDTGISPEACVAIAEGYHADVVGTNCSVGPEAMLQVAKRMVAVSRMPVAVQPNAGLPQLKNGLTVFPLNAQAMAEFIQPFLTAGVRVIGGCCGTTPEYIAHVRGAVDQFKTVPLKAPTHARVFIASKTQTLSLGTQYPFAMIGEKINPTGRKKVAEQIRSGNVEALMGDAIAQVQAGAHCLDVNVGVPLIDEPAMMGTTIVTLQNAVDVPLVIDSSFSTALETGGKVYYGRPLLNSINAEEEKLEEVIPIARKIGGALIALTTETEVPVKAEDRLKFAKKILDRLSAEGFTRDDIVFDVLGLTVSAMRDASLETLRTIQLITEELGCATTLGLSNVSFGLPNRRFVHQSFLMNAIARGLSSAIMNVTEESIATRVAAAQLFSGQDGAVEAFLKNHSTPIAEGASRANVPAQAPATEADDPTKNMSLDELQREIFWCVVDGQKQKIEELTKRFVAARSDEAFSLFLNVMTPAIRYLGDLFAQRKRFIPHLVAAAEAMKSGVHVLEPFLAKTNGGAQRGTIVFATVKGDIHDIGKNICILMLRNFGYNVIDLGRNVPMESIFETAREKKAHIIALSALMTTTMIQMKLLIEQNRQKGYPFRVMVGGAPVTKEFAKEIGADGHSTDVGGIVGESERVFQALGYVNA